MFGLLGLLLAGLAVAGWYGYTRYLSPSPEQLLVGRWEGTGQHTSHGSFTVKPGPGVPGGKESLTLRFTNNVRAEFRPDRTYSWDEKADAGGMTLTITMPKPGEPPPTWEITRVGHPTSTLRFHGGEFDISFQGRDAFTLRWALEDSSGDITFKRKS